MPEIIESELEPVSKLSISASLIGKVNLADYQNAVPALRELTVVNGTDSARERLVVSVLSEPSFLKPKQWHIDAIGAGQTCHISNLDLQLDGPLLGRLTESEVACVRFELRQAQGDDTLLAVYEHDVELLPRNHWGGLSHLPEMVAAFAQPNDPAIEKVLKRAAELLRASGKNPALNGYGSGPKHAWEILSAIWGAVAARKLDYALPPASFERSGQKVRSATQVLDSGLGTCLDLALLFAGAAEQAGLNPLVVFTAGHAFTGCWLRPEEFGAVVTDDPSALRKRIRLHELILFETTVVTEQPAPPFSRAVDLGAKQIAEDAAAAFESAVDIRRARMHKIRPLAAEAAPDRPSAQDVTATTEILIEEAPELPDDTISDGAVVDPRTLTPADRVARWQRKLLDLSLRNSLLNFRRGKRAVLLEAPEPAKLEDALAEGEALKLLPRPPLMEGADPRSRAIHESRSHEDLWRQHALEGQACSGRKTAKSSVAVRIRTGLYGRSAFQYLRPRFTKGRMSFFSPSVRSFRKVRFTLPSGMIGSTRTYHRTRRRGVRQACPTYVPAVFGLPADVPKQPGVVCTDELSRAILTDARYQNLLRR